MNIDKDAFFEKIGYKPTTSQIDFHKSEARFKLAVCGRRFGKSTMAARDIEPLLFEPNKRFWIVGPTYYLGEKEFRVIWQDLMINMGLANDRRIRKSYNKKQGNMFIEFPWNTIIEVRSATDPDSLVGEKLSGVIMAEAAKHNKDTWDKYIRPSLSDEKGFAVFTTTPEGYNWLYYLYLEALKPENADIEAWRIPSWENYIVYPGGREDPEIKLMERTMPDDRFRQEIGAEFTTFVGKIYPEFDPTVHIRAHEYNPDWPNYQFWDFGFVNALCCLDVQVSPFDEVFVWREFYENGVRLEDALQSYKYMSHPEGYRVDYAFGDAADPEAITTINKMWSPCIGLMEAKKNWRQGVEVVKRFLSSRESGDREDDSLPSVGLYVDSACEETIKEFMIYQMASTNSKNDPVERPTKKNDHAMDALRYGLMHLFELGAVHHLDEVAEANSDNYNANYSKGLASIASANQPTRRRQDNEMMFTALNTSGFFTADLSF